MKKYYEEKNGKIAKMENKEKAHEPVETYSFVMLANEEDVLLIKDIQRILRIGRNSAYELVSSGRIKSIQIGSKRIVPKLYLIDFLKTAS